MNVKHKRQAVRTAAILTDSYVAGTILGEKGGSPSGDAIEFTQLILYISFTKGSLTTAEVKIEFSEDGTTYYQETFTSESGGTSTDTAGVHSFGATGNFRIPVPINDKYIKVSAKGTGTVTNSSMAIDAVLATN